MDRSYLVIETKRAISDRPVGLKHFKESEYIEYLAVEVDMLIHRLRLMFLGGDGNE